MLLLWPTLCRWSEGIAGCQDSQAMAAEADTFGRKIANGRGGKASRSGRRIVAMESTRQDWLFDSAFVARLEQLHLMAKRLSGRASAATLRRSRRLGDGLEFADHRAYAPGDDVRFLDWTAYARTDRLLRRLFHEHSEADVVILLDVSASMGAEQATFDYARRTAAALAYVSATSLERVRLVPLSEGLQTSMTTGRRAEGMGEVLTFLSGLSSGGRTDLSGSVGEFVGRLAQPATVLLISDLLDCQEQLPDALTKLQQARCDVTVVHVISPQDAAGHSDGAVSLQAVEDGGRLDLDITDDLRTAYRECWESFIETCRRSCLSRQSVYVGASTDEPFEKLVLESLRRAGVLSG
jgi:uncharacterized protein (DUF58 family)